MSMDRHSTGGRLWRKAVAMAIVAGICAAQEWSWQQTQAVVSERGELLWAPAPYTFRLEGTPRYIDYERGRDSNPGSRGSPWKHHPWDPEATGRARDCAGPHTYVFRGGTVYRGRLVVRESGQPDAPILLTSDPSWGDGPAMIYGSEQVTDWVRGAHPDMPDPERVWMAEIAFDPRCVWQVTPDGIQRLALARTPNWTEANPDDVKSQWWMWHQVRQGRNAQGKEINIGLDPEHLTEPVEIYRDAIVWTEFLPVMGTAYPTAVEAVDPETRGIHFLGFWYGGSRSIEGNRYYLEDRPRFLDSGGEFWFEKQGEHGGRLYVRLPDDRDPNTTTVEVGRHLNLIDADAMSHVYISGLIFRFTNVWWDITARFFKHKDVDSACIRMLGSGADIRVTHCRFEHVSKAVRIKAAADDDAVDRILVADCEIRHTDHGAIDVADSSRWGKTEPPFSSLGDVQIMRNRLHRIGFRPIRSEHGHAVDIRFARTLEIAGNILTRCYGAGLFVFGGKGSGQLRDAPLSRVLIHHNSVVDSLLNTNDWGGIETWQGGPFYVYGNISGNPGGFWHWKWRFSQHKEPSERQPADARFGFAYYLDGSSKNYVFNNVAWGRSNQLGDALCNTAAFQEVHPNQNMIFLNTVCNFAVGSRAQKRAGGRGAYLGNIFMDLSAWAFRHAAPRDAEADGNADQINERPGEALRYEGLAYTRNLFHNPPREFGVFEADGQRHQTLEAFRDAMRQHGAVASGVGRILDAAPVRNAAAHDFRPLSDGPAVDQGVRVFVPWALYATVGEWHFRRQPNAVTRLRDDHWYMTPYYAGREHYHETPRYHLTAVNVRDDDYVQGVLEDWAPGALRFNGRDQYAMITDAEMKRPYTYRAGREERTVKGRLLMTPDIGRGNFLIEVYLQVRGGTPQGVIVRKAAGNGYVMDLAGGRPRLILLQDGEEVAVRLAASTVNDGRWHHVIAEVDRSRNDGITMYVDGRADNAGFRGRVSSFDLSNPGALCVGGAPGLIYLPATIEFLRIARGTLADARTTIEELYAWQFDGPFLRDLAGHPARGARRDAGAFEAR